MLTRMVAGTIRRTWGLTWTPNWAPTWRLACGATGLVLLATSIASAQGAGGVAITTCAGGFLTFGCVERWGPAVDPNIRTVPRDPKDDAVLAERDARWMARCRPVIRQDRYGVPRYHYAAAGCEHGVIE
jgi:hypothetical protein